MNRTPSHEGGKMKRNGIPIAALATLPVSLATPPQMNGQWMDDGPHITISGQVALDFTDHPNLGAAVQCVLCNTQTCSPEMPESSRVQYVVVQEPLGWSASRRILNLDTQAHTGQPWTYDFQIPMYIETENLASSIRSYACQLRVNDLVVGPGAESYIARPREGTPFTGLVTGLVP